MMMSWSRTWSLQAEVEGKQLENFEGKLLHNMSEWSTPQLALHNPNRPLRQPLFRRRFPFHPPPVTTLLPSSSSLLPPPPFQSHPLKENRFKTGIMFLPIHFPNRVLTHLCPPCRRSAVQVKNSRLESHSTPLHRTRE